MPRGQRAADQGADRARAIAASVIAELRLARRDRGLSQAAVGRAVGLSAAQVSRVERGIADAPTLRQLAMMAAVVGLELAVRAYPAGEPLRDVAHAALLERLRSRLHRSLRFRTEVPLPRPGDLRAWDAVIAGSGWILPVEAETRPLDFQALDRRLNLKLRDSDGEDVLLLLLDSRHNRSFIAAHRASLATRFAVPGPRALELLAAGARPGGSSVVLL